MTALRRLPLNFYSIVLLNPQFLLLFWILSYPETTEMLDLGDASADDRNDDGSD